MSSRAEILKAVAANQPAFIPLPDTGYFKGANVDLPGKFITVLTAIGGRSVSVNNWAQIAADIKSHQPDLKRIISVVPELPGLKVEAYIPTPAAHVLADVDLAIIRAHFAVAENGAIWVTEEIIGNRALPFICQHLAVVVDIKQIMPTMHEAYQYLQGQSYGFGTFIAGPSKTADIEQSLVLGAHGPKSMTVYLLSDELH